MKISFLIPAHNEEKIISKTLSSLVALPYKDYEVIIGLDGCTDKTEGIVKSFAKRCKKISYYSLNLRKGKPAVIDSIIKKARGDIIIINDADWIFEVESRSKLESFLKAFDDKNVGGIAESFPVEFSNNLNESNFFYKMVAYSSLFWLNFQKERFTFSKGSMKFIEKPEMFLTNIFRRKLYEKTVSLGDDFERTFSIFKKGYKIAIYDDPSMPRMIATYNAISLSDLFKQKVRTAIARSQLNNARPIKSSYYLNSVIYINKEGYKKGLTIGFAMTLWSVLNIAATFISLFKKSDTKEGWKLRASR